MSFISVLKKIGDGVALGAPVVGLMLPQVKAAQVATRYIPPILTAVSHIIQTILDAEAQEGSGAGAKKFAIVANVGARQVTPQLIQHLEAILSSADVVDEQRAAAAIQGLSQNLVDLLNSIREKA